jgi:hypothetical protein
MESEIHRFLFGVDDHSEQFRNTSSCQCVNTGGCRTASPGRPEVSRLATLDRVQAALAPQVPRGTKT